METISTTDQDQDQNSGEGREGTVAFQESSRKPSPSLNAAHAELLADLQAWIEFALEKDIKFRSGRVPPTFTDGYSYVEIPEWSMRQKLAAIRMVLEGITEEDVEETRNPTAWPV